MLSPMKNVVIRGRREDLETEESHVNAEAEVGVREPQAAEYVGPAEAVRHREDPPQSPHRGHSPADALNVDF